MTDKIYMYTNTNTNINRKIMYKYKVQGAEIIVIVPWNVAYTFHAPVIIIKITNHFSKTQVTSNSITPNADWVIWARLLLDSLCNQAYPQKIIIPNHINTATFFTKGSNQHTNFGTTESETKVLKYS